MPYPIETYEGSYENNAYGKAAVYADNGELRLNFNKSMVCSLEHSFQNTFKSELWGAPARVEFSLDLQRNVTSLEIQFEGTDYVVRFDKVTK